MNIIEQNLKNQQKVINRLSRKIQKKNQKIEAAENVLLHFKDTLETNRSINKRMGATRLVEEYEFLIQMLDYHLDKLKEK